MKMAIFRGGVCQPSLSPMEESLTPMKSKSLLTALALCLAAPTFVQMPPLVDREGALGEPGNLGLTRPSRDF